MTLPISNNDPEAKLAAFADGELEGEQSLEVLQRIQTDPGLAQRVDDQHKLRSAIAKAMGSGAKAPDSLRHRIAELARTVPAESATPAPRSQAQPDSPVLARIGRWVPAAVAALFLIGALVVLNLAGDKNTHTGIGAGLITASNSLNSSLVDQFGERHVKCSRDLSEIHGTDQFPQNLEKLPGALSDYLHHPVNPDVLDLSALGFEFQVAGICILPGRGSVHLIYELPNDRGGQDALSFWIRPYEEGSGIEADHLYTTAQGEAAYPMVVWRHADMVYYLVGDSTEAVNRALEAIKRDRG